MGNLVLMPIGLLAGVIMLELGLRIFGVSYPSFHVADELRGLAPRPGAEGWYRQEGEAYIQINRAGFRDSEHAKPKPLDTVRIAVLGDSYVEALQVPIEESFWRVMERELRECDDLRKRQIEVVNFGVGGYGTAQELITLRHYVWDYSPDIILLAFVTGNDISDNSPELTQSEYIPYFYFQGNELILDRSYLESDEYRLRASWIPRLLDYSRVLQVTNRVRYSIRTEIRRWKASEALRAAAEDADNDELGISSTIYHEPMDPIWAEAWHVTEGLLKLMMEEIAQQGASFLVVTMSNGVQVHPDPSVRKSFMETQGIADLFYPDLRIKALGDREGFEVLNLAGNLQAYAEEHQVFLHGFENTTLGKGHWNAEGHRIAGQMIAQHLCEILLAAK